MNNKKLHIKEPGFKTPKNYFENLESQIMEEVSLASKLSKENPFKVPEKYFDELDHRVLNQTSGKKKQPKVIPIYRNIMFRYVAGIAALLLVFFSIFKLQQTVSSETNTITQIESYIENGFLDLSYLDYEALLTDEMLEDTSFISNLEQEELFEYLSYEIDEILLTTD